MPRPALERPLGHSVSSAVVACTPPRDCPHRARLKGPQTGSFAIRRRAAKWPRRSRPTVLCAKAVAPSARSELLARNAPREAASHGRFAGENCQAKDRLRTRHPVRTLTGRVGRFPRQLSRRATDPTRPASAGQGGSADPGLPAARHGKKKRLQAQRAARERFAPRDVSMGSPRELPAAQDRPFGAVFRST
jgi:hypothetical protein